MPPPLPSLAEIATSAAVLEAVVPPEFIDVNGHMNVQHYLHLGTQGAGVLVDLLGLDDAYRRDRRLSVFTRKHHVEYLSELVLDDEVRVHSFVLDRSRTALHTMTYVVDVGHTRLAATVEALLIHVDLMTRRPVPIPDDLAARIDTEIDRSSVFGVLHPLSGSMSLRR